MRPTGSSGSWGEEGSDLGGGSEARRRSGTQRGGQEPERGGNRDTDRDFCPVPPLLIPQLLSCATQPETGSSLGAL